jgi:uncharacterized protein YukE
LRRVAADGDAAPALLPRQLALLDRAKSLQASVAAAIERRAAAASTSTSPGLPEGPEQSQRALEQARVALDEIAASLEPAESP